MERQLVTVQQIAEIQPIEQADFIERVRVNDWWVVAKKGEFAVGDKCVYFEIDSLLPDVPGYEFLKNGKTLKRMVVDGVVKVGIRLTTAKLRGQISQGLVLPIYPATDHPVGTDVTEFLGVIKYEKPIPTELSGIAKGLFPAFIPKTDEERVQNMGSILPNHTGQKFYVTEKVDGSSMTVFKKDGVLGVCSRNLELQYSESNSLWKMATKYNLVNNLPEGWAVQGEIAGEGLNGNRLKLTGFDFYIYNVYLIDSGRYLNWDEMKEFCDERLLNMVPLIDANFILDEFYTQVPNLLAMAEGASYLNEAAQREGIVMRPVVEQQIPWKGGKMRLSFKVISNKYLLDDRDE